MSRFYRIFIRTRIFSRSRLLEEGLADRAHRKTAARARACLRDYERQNLGSTVHGGRVRRAQISHVGQADQDAVEALAGRARRLSFFMTQPYHGTEMWIGEPGETVALADTVEGARRILDGGCDQVPERALQNVGGLEQVVSKGEQP